ncbi:hypothetical protein [Microbacterium rhizomatis]|uniref:Uncharacterized protein n=1 Tax=Microbacterium rhizomatis TaxID=1631477 RepID=A0A5J5IY08_9MICO|nr:hypothetical protein [Microbacterium rhizomatis]KAA9106381.1 hypothetical protein F6B43_14590 [Microbacterium rhizomatis]
MADPLRTLTAIAIGATLVCGVGLSGGGADAADNGPIPDALMVDGQRLDADDGLTITTESFEMASGGGRVGTTYYTDPPTDGVISPQWVEGSSFAYAEEVVQLGYVGHGKAGANVSGGQRIVQVCFWWSRGGVRLTSNFCSDASFANGSWVAGREVTGSMNDTLDPVAPPTIFNISTARVDPNL